MFVPDIAVIRAVQSDRIQRDVSGRTRHQVARRRAEISAVRAIRRSVGRSFVRVGERIAADHATDTGLRLAR